MYFKKPLVITDNVLLCERFMALLKELAIEIPFHFAVSTHSDIALFKKIFPGIFAIDLKQEASVDHLLNSYDLIFSIHSKQLFPKRLVEGVKCINIHPGYNPINRGWYPQVFSIIEHQPIGATIHEIDTELDHGPVIARAFVTKHAWDTSGSLYNRILDKEVELLKLHLKGILENNYTAIAVKGEGEIHYKKDFNRLLELDLSKKMKLGEAIDLLRALTHEPYSNAYFITESGEKVFVKIRLEKTTA